MPRPTDSLLNRALLFPIIVASLGYFVDVYDLILFSIVRVSSLKSLGFSGDDLLKQGVFLINMQMAGMLIGGVLWGIFGDKRGRIQVLFGSILMYSLANIANAMVSSVGAYAFWRFVAGIGLAGELGAGITLVSEILPKNKRGIGTTLVASVGICGALLAAFVADVFDWRVAFHIGGFLGLALLLLRVGTMESGMFKNLLNKPVVDRGNFFSLFTERKRFLRYLRCILIGLPVWYVLGILVTFAPEIARSQGLVQPIDPGHSVMIAYVGLALGDLTSGAMSQLLRSRRKVIITFLLITFLMAVLYLGFAPVSSFQVYALCCALGFGVGYWAVFVTTAAEQFGTNIRATVATTAPNFVRGSLVLLSSLFLYLKPSLGVLRSAQVVGGGTLAIALLAAVALEESFHKDLDFFEG